MSSYPNVAAEAADKYLAMLAQGQDQFVEFVRSSRELMPRMPEGFNAPAPAMPFAMPSPRDIADAQFQFVTKLLKQQEGFVRQFYKSSGTQTPAKRSASAASKSTPAKSRSTARKTTRKTKASS